MSRVNLDGVRMFVSSTASNGVVDSRTEIVFSQRGPRVIGRYAGGRIQRGVLVGVISGEVLTFRYVQVEATREIHGGRSTGEITRTLEGRLRVVEQFEWTTRDGSGTNVFDELPAPVPPV